MKYLLDTHTLLWIVTDDKQLSRKVKKLFLDEENEIFFSITSLWEVAIKVSLGRLELGQPLSDFCSRHIIGNKIRLLDIKLEHLEVLETLEFYHRDPFDRLIVCQSMVKKFLYLALTKCFRNILSPESGS